MGAVLPPLDLWNRCFTLRYVVFPHRGSYYYGQSVYFAFVVGVRSEEERAFVARRIGQILSVNIRCDLFLSVICSSEGQWHQESFHKG